MVWFGDIDIPWLTEKDTSVEIPNVELNPHDGPPQVYELTPDLEAGTYTAILNKDVHDRSENLDEQEDAVKSMVSRHASEFPFDFSGDKGHLLVEQSTTFDTPSDVAREASLAVRFLDDRDYRPAVTAAVKNTNGDYNIGSEESAVPIPSSATNVENKTSSITSDFTLTTDEGDLDFYVHSGEGAVVWDRPSDYTSGERIAPVRVYALIDGTYSEVYGDDYGSDILRVYSSLLGGSGGDLFFENRQIRCDVYGNYSDISLLDSGTWNVIGEVNVGGSTVYSSVNANYLTELKTPQSSFSMRRGYPVIQFDIEGESTFQYTSETDLTVQDSTEDWYRVSSDANGNDIIVVRKSSDGSFSEGTDTVSVSGLDSSSEYTFFVGTVPDALTYSDFAKYVYNIGSWRRSLVQR